MKTKEQIDIEVAEMEKAIKDAVDKFINNNMRLIPFPEISIMEMQLGRVWPIKRYSDVKTKLKDV